MLSYVLRRLGLAVPTTLGVCTVLFAALHLAPGNAADHFTDPEWPYDVREAIERNLGLDQPLPVQYGKWLGAMARLDFGRSFSRHRPVLEVLTDAMPFTLALCGTSLLLVFALGIPVGVLSASRRGTRGEAVVHGGCLVVYAVPSFLLALLLLLVFAHQLPWLPASGPQGTDYHLLSPAAQVWDRLVHMVLPVLALTLAPAAGVARYTRASMLEVLEQPFVRAARARGLDERRVVVRHALRNALLPLVTLLGLYLPFLLAGSVLVESVFAWPGMGKLIVDAIGARDLPLVLGNAVLYTFAVIGGNLLADVLYAAADPRVRLR